MRYSVRPSLTTAGHHHQAQHKGPGPQDHALIVVDLGLRARKGSFFGRDLELTDTGSRS
jgi:hypothetical protein